MKHNLKIKQSPVQGRIVLAEGEVTGHHHSFSEGSAVLYADDAKDVNSFLTVTAEVAPLEHQEHATIIHPKGNYAAIRQEEWTDSDEPITVAD